MGRSRRPIAPLVSRPIEATRRSAVVLAIAALGHSEKAI